MTLTKRSGDGANDVFRLEGTNSQGAGALDITVQGPNVLGIWLVNSVDLNEPGNAPYRYPRTSYVQVYTDDLVAFMRLNGLVPEDPAVHIAKVNALALILDSALQSGDSFQVTAARLLRTGQVDIPDVPNV